METEYEIFGACKNNDLKRLSEVLDMGADINLVDYDSQSTPLMYAASNGAKHVMEFLLARGANINAQNVRGVTSLHHLISKRFDNQGIWLVKMGANLHLSDRKGITARDLAQPWIQKELDAASAAQNVEDTGRKSEMRLQPIRESTLMREEPMRVFFANGASKLVTISTEMTANHLLTGVAEKIHLTSDTVQYLEVLEVKKSTEYRKIGNNDKLWELKTQWPLVLSSSGNETEKAYYFKIVVRKGSPEWVTDRYEKALLSI